MRWPWQPRTPEPGPTATFQAMLMTRLYDLEGRVDQLTRDKTIILGAQPAVTKLPDDWPITVGTVARLVRQVEGLQAQLGTQQAEINALREPEPPRRRRRRVR